MTDKKFTFRILKRNQFNNPDIDAVIDPHEQSICAPDLKGALYELYPGLRYRLRVYRPWQHHDYGLYIWAHWTTVGEHRVMENYRLITCDLFDRIGEAYREFTDDDVEHMLAGDDPVFLVYGKSDKEYGLYENYDAAWRSLYDIKEGCGIELKWVRR